MIITQINLDIHVIDRMILCLVITVFELSSLLAISSLKHLRYLFCLWLKYFVASVFYNFIKKLANPKGKVGEKLTVVCSIS